MLQFEHGTSLPREDLAARFSFPYHKTRRHAKGSRPVWDTLAPLV
ncbi:MAG: hypothetical protein BLITH_0420 [Brockia lithotrophica]|uniref:Uncharacterized protein n=1 Tax=Brockia lithotrophica TaxID=933949 RepID=A0A2T5GAY2_9BACL|nr:MAG: hypothetical protein BLITH_0420 [Brockia lithotrophica]